MENFTVLRVLLLLYFVHKGKFLSKPYRSGRNKFLLGKILSSVLIFSFNDFYSCFNSYKERFRVITANYSRNLCVTSKTHILYGNQML